MEITSSPPNPPSEAESIGYYGGFPSNPRLVARSDADIKPWSLKPNSFDPVGRHRIVPLWNDYAGPLRQTILEALKETDWMAINVLRIGHEWRGNPIKMLITVKQGSTTWPAGWAVVIKCRDILRHHGFVDVEVEMKERCFI